MTYNTTRRKPLRGPARQAFLEAHGSLCLYCKLPILSGQPWQDCHIIARELGGSDEMSNRAPGHVECHKVDTREVARLVAKGNRLIRKNGPIENRRKSKSIPSRPMGKSGQAIQGRGFGKRPA